MFARTGRQSWVLLPLLVLGSVASHGLADPPERPVAGRPAAFSPRQYADHIEKLRRLLPDEELHYVVEAPFVVVGNESAETVEKRAVGTVRWAVEKLKAEYFEKDPSQILTIWLFKDRESYERLAEKLYGSRPGTPYGYYLSGERALVMNISTGGGTLVHEIVHPFVEANFPKCPAWFNEGLGSLYEMSEERDGRIAGRTNWRLAGLQQAIRAEAVPTFREMCATTTTEFYRADRGTNYSQARYLCYYLQEHGLLREFYQKFHAAQESDPSGYATLRAVLGNPDMETFQADWQDYVMKLKFP